MKSVHFTSRRKHIIRNNDVISHLESSFSFSKQFTLLFGSPKNSVKLWGSYKSIFYRWRNWGQNVNAVSLFPYIEIKNVKSLSRVRLCDSMDCSPPGSSVHGIFQARVLEWVAISFSRGSSWTKDQTQIPCILGRRFYHLSLQGSPVCIGTAPIYISIHSVQWFPFPHTLTSIYFVSYNLTKFIYEF